MTSPLRPALYLRVSGKEQLEGYSIDVQERTLRAFCAAQGWHDPAIYVEPGHSAHLENAAKRPVWRKLMADAAHDTFDVVLVHKLDRWARHAPTAMAALASLDKLGVGFVSFSENMNFTGPWGKAIFGILSIFAQLSSDNLSHEVKKGLTGRKLAGKPPHSRPYGAMVQGDRLVVDPSKAAHLARILELAATKSGNAAAQQLNDEGVPSRQGGGWHPQSVRAIVRRGGWLAEQPHPWPGRWAAALGARVKPPVRKDRQVRLLTGLMRCGVCGGRIHYGPRGHGGKGALTLQCNRAPNGPLRCLPGAPRKTAAAHYEAVVVAAVGGLPDERLLRHAAERLAARADPALEELAAIREERERLEVAWVRGGLRPETHAAMLAELDMRQNAIAPIMPNALRFVTLLSAVRDLLPTYTPAEANAAVRIFVQEVIITGRECHVVFVPILQGILAETEARIIAA